jgi:Uma2 family endonuclease
MSEKIFDQAIPNTIIEENVSFEDFCLRYEGQRVEWHAGKVIAKMSNNEQHQYLLNLLQTILNLYLMFTQKGRLYSDGYQMRLGDDIPARQPDLLIVFKEHYERIKHQYLDGAADVVIEIISPATGHVDRGDKYYEYQNGAVPEYWIIDPESKRVDIYHLDDEGHYQPIQADGKIISKELPNFVLDTVLLWQDNLPEGQEVVDLVQGMIKDK